MLNILQKVACFENGKEERICELSIGRIFGKRERHETIRTFNLIWIGFSRGPLII